MSGSASGGGNPNGKALSSSDNFMPLESLFYALAILAGQMVRAIDKSN